MSGEVAAPTGDDHKEIGGGGEWGIFLRAGRYQADSGVHLQIGYEQQIELTAAQKARDKNLDVR